MRWVWTDAGDDPSWHIGDAHGINGYFAPLGDPLTPSVLEEAGRRGHAQGCYFGHNWLPGQSAENVAKWVNDRFVPLRNRFPRLRVMFNLEEHDPEFVADVLEEWRDLQPRTNTSWSPEGMQGGWMDPGFVARVMACRVRVVPQAFGNIGGNPVRRFESDQILRDLTRRGFPEHIVTMFYPANELGLDWDGYCFRMGLLPQ